jgi:hypothetical protein
MANKSFYDILKDAKKGSTFDGHHTGLTCLNENHFTDKNEELKFAKAWTKLTGQKRRHV